MKTPPNRLALAAFCALFAAGCTSTQEKEKSAPEHRAEAERHRKDARDALDGYDPAGKEVRVDPKAGTDRTGPMDTSPDSLAFPVESYNPTNTQMKKAERLLAHAAQHEEAAKKLEKKAEELCGAFPKEIRTQSPLVGNLTEVELIARGVRLRFRKDLPLDAVFAHIQCHLALAQAVGYETVVGCPLHLRGVEAKREFDAVVLAGQDVAVIKQIQDLAMAEFDAK